MSDPTYDPEVLRTNGVWQIAFVISEMVNDAAPVGWSRFIPLANQVLADAQSAEAKRLSRRAP